MVYIGTSPEYDAHKAGGNIFLTNRMHDNAGVRGGILVALFLIFEAHLTLRKRSISSLSSVSCFGTRERYLRARWPGFRIGT